MIRFDQPDAPTFRGPADMTAPPPDPRQGDLIKRAFQEARALQGQGKVPEAEKLYGLILEAEPDHFPALVRVGMIRIGQGEVEEAVALLKRAAAAVASSAPAQVSLAVIFTGLGRPADAIACYQSALDADPRHADAHCNLGNVLQSVGRRDEAIAHYQQALAIRPDFPEAHSNLGNVLQMLGRREEAVAHYEQALALKPDYVEARCNLAAAFLALNRPQDAIGHYQKTLAARPDFAEGYHGAGIALQVVGRLDDAGRAFERAIALAPGRADFHLRLAYARPFVAGDPRLEALEELARDPRLGDGQQIAVHFALGKAFADLDQPEQSFRHLSEGNARKRRRVVYEEKDTLQSFDRIRQVFTADLMCNNRGRGDPSSLPVFVVGMPRSGTTLIEQIMASHSAVFGAGELDEVANCIASLETANRSSLGYPELVATISGEELRRLASRYLGRVRTAAPWAERIVDKMPSNFCHLGLIHLALPHARIIHVQRDPLDTCLSCFSILFVGDQPYTYDLGELGRYYGAYRALMDHWRDVLPPGVMLNVHYEDVVDNLEVQARRIIAHCGLAWEESCLRFHETQRQVQTASAFQVRQPIYRRSIGRWRLYKDMLRPLLEALDPRG